MLALWIVWAFLTLFVIGLALYRKWEAHFHEDDLVHLAEGEAKYIPQQIATGRELDKIDTWGKALTTVSLLFGLVLVAIMLYSAWQRSLQLHQ